MKTVKEYINSGILQSYVLGITSSEEQKEVEDMAAAYPEVRVAIDEFSIELEEKTRSAAVAPHPSVRQMVMATIDYMERLQNGEKPSFPPLLHERSRISDYIEWLNRPDIVFPDDFDGIHAKIIGYTPNMTTAIVWMSELPPETHDNAFEKFLIVEGSCEMTIDKEVFLLYPGDYMAIPLFKMHKAISSSTDPCKFILQRVAV